MSDITVEADRFGIALSGILSRVSEQVEASMEEPVRESAKVARKEWRDRAPRKTGAYFKSITYTVKKATGDVHAEVGSKTLPGLPHLLEKGHATIGGGHTRAFKHIAPAADSAIEVFERRMPEAVESALRSV